jgi:hypothetical protein
MAATPGTAEQRQYMSRALAGHIVGLRMTSNLIFVRARELAPHLVV